MGDVGDVGEGEVGGGGIGLVLLFPFVFSPGFTAGGGGVGGVGGRVMLVVGGVGAGSVVAVGFAEVLGLGSMVSVSLVGWSGAVALG